MSIIDTSFFTGRFQIPQLSQADVATDLQSFIDMYEEEILQNAMGYLFYNDFKAGINATTVDPKWQQLLDGFYFTNQYGYGDQFKGFKPANNQSVIVPFIYYQWLRAKQSQLTGTGMVMQPQSENAITNVASWKMTEAWNYGADGMQSLWRWLMVNVANQNNPTALYPSYQYAQINYKYFNKINAFGI